MPRLCSVLLSLLIASSASGVTMSWTPGRRSGQCLRHAVAGCFGAVGYDYLIGTYEVTNAQYAEFLNGKAASDPLALYNTGMGSSFGGIARTGSPGGFGYSAIAGRGEVPVNFVSFYDALRFSNWLQNGQTPTLNLEHPDSRCAALDYVIGAPRELAGDVVVSNNFAFGGVNTSLVFRRWPEDR